MGYSQKNIQKSEILILAILWTFGASFLAITYYLAYSSNFSYTLFWISILLCGISTLFIMLDNDAPRKYKIIFLFMWGFVLYLPQLLWSCGHFHFQDEIWFYQSIKLIEELGTLNIGPLYYETPKYYPSLQLLTISLKSITNLPLLLVVRLLIGITHSLLLVFLYLFFDKITSTPRIAAVASFLYTTNPEYVFHDAIFSYESLGICLIALLLFLISKQVIYSKNSNKACLSFLTIISVLALVITHHFSAYMFLLFIIILALLSKAFNERKFLFNFVLLTTSLIISWIIYVATILMIQYNAMLSYVIDDLFSIIFETKIQRMPFAGSSPPPFYETFIITFLYMPLLILMFIIGLYFIRKYKNFNDYFTYTLATYGVLFFLFSITILTKLPVGGRMWAFTSIGVSFVIAIGVESIFSCRRNKLLSYTTFVKVLSFVAIILIMVGGISIGCKPDTRVPYSSNFASGPSTLTSDIFYASNWFEEQFGRHNKMIGDLTSSWVFTCYGMQNAIPYRVWQVFFPEKIDDTVIKYLKSRHINFIIVDERISKYPPTYKFYFDETELNPENALHIQPLPYKCLDKFEDTNLFYKLYDNGNIDVYKVELIIT